MSPKGLPMRNLLKLEEAAMFIFGLVLLLRFDLPWWLLLILFFTPDLGAMGYVMGPRFGAITYNALHHKAVALGLLLIGVMSTNEYFRIAGLIIFAHSSFDRMLGFGLKYPDSFSNSHLGPIGKAAQIKK
jgi:hypothetical protein